MLAAVVPALIGGVASAAQEMLAVVSVLPSPASLNEHTSWPLLLIVALALMKCGLSARAAVAPRASVATIAAVATTIDRRDLLILLLR